MRAARTLGEPIVLGSAAVGETSGALIPPPIGCRVCFVRLSVVAAAAAVVLEIKRAGSGRIVSSGPGH
jgi:hypothetical protein